MVNRRTFTQLLAMSLAATAAPPLPAWAQARKRNIVIGHTGITWPGRAPRGGGPPTAPTPPPAAGAQAPPAAAGAAAPGGARRGGGPPPDPALNEAIFNDVSELGFSGLELFDWQINGLESQGVLAGFVEKFKLPLVSSYTSINLTDPAQRR